MKNFSLPLLITISGLLLIPYTAYPAVPHSNTASATGVELIDKNGTNDTSAKEDNKAHAGKSQEKDNKKVGSAGKQHDIKQKKGKTHSKKSIAEFKAYVDKSLITIGDRIKYTLEVDADRSVDVDFPSYVSNLGGFAVRDFGKDKAVKSGKNRVRVKQWYIMDTFTTGSYVIPSQSALVRTASGKEYRLKSPEIFVEVKSVIGDKEEKPGLRDIKFPVHIPFNIPSVFIVISLLVISAAVTAWMLYRRRKLKEKEKPLLPVHEQAMLELKRIEDMGLLEKGQIKEYYYMVSDVLRRYLEGRFSLRAPEQTTEEFIENMSRSDALEDNYIELLKEYMFHCDMVKYAKLEPARTECSKLIETTRRFVEETKDSDNDSSGYETGENLS